MRHCRGLAGLGSTPQQRAEELAAVGAGGGGGAGCDALAGAVSWARPLVPDRRTGGERTGPAPGAWPPLAINTGRCTHVPGLEPEVGPGGGWLGFVPGLDDPLEDDPAHALWGEEWGRAAAEGAGAARPRLHAGSRGAAGGLG